MIITAANAIAEANGIDMEWCSQMHEQLFRELQVLDDKPDLADKLLKRLAEWCIRFTPSVAVDPPDGLLLDVTGCSHLWGGDQSYLTAIVKKLNARRLSCSGCNGRYHRRCLGCCTVWKRFSCY